MASTRSTFLAAVAGIVPTASL